MTNSQSLSKQFSWEEFDTIRVVYLEIIFEYMQSANFCLDYTNFYVMAAAQENYERRPHRDENQNDDFLVETKEYDSNVRLCVKCDSFMTHSVWEVHFERCGKFPPPDRSPELILFPVEEDEKVYPRNPGFPRSSTPIGMRTPPIGRRRNVTEDSLSIKSTDLFTCPYDYMHLIRRRYMESHMQACRERHPELNWDWCYYCHALLAISDLNDHMARCDKRPMSSLM